MGHSFGGSTAVWLANELRKHNKMVDELLLLVGLDGHHNSGTGAGVGTA